MSFPGKLVGRDKEQTGIRAALDKALAGRGGLLLIGGEAGIGKTRLVDEVLSSTGELHLKYACQELRTPAFAPVAAILRQYLRLTSGDLSAAGALAARRRAGPPARLMGRDRLRLLLDFEL